MDLAHCAAQVIDLTLGEHLQILVKDGTKPAISLTRGSLEPKLLQSVFKNSCMAYRLVTNLEA